MYLPWSYTDLQLLGLGLMMGAGRGLMDRVMGALGAQGLLFSGISAMGQELANLLGDLGFHRTILMT